MTNLSRRSFVTGSAVSLSTAASASAAKNSRVLGANDRLRIGVIGCGGMATAHINALLKMTETDNVEIVAVCDVYRKRLDRAQELTGAKPFHDYRKLLETKDIDYVLIATPEHQHAPMTLDAADAGKHIYCEKPMTYTVEEGKQVVKKIEQTGVKMQVGVQGMSDDSYQAAQNYIDAGELGKVVLAQVDYSRNHLDDFWTNPYDNDVRPGENLDWDAFLGNAPKRPFDPDRFFSWRRYWDYSGGIATDLFVHRITRLIRSINLKTPARVVATGGKFCFTDSAAEIPDTFNMMADYPQGLTLLVISSMANRSPVRHMIRGHKATLEFDERGFIIRPEQEFAEESKRIIFDKTGAEDLTLHHRNLQAAIRTNEPLNCDVHLGFYGSMACLMAVESYRTRRYLAWDARREKIVKA